MSLRDRYRWDRARSWAFVVGVMAANAMAFFKDAGFPMWARIVLSTVTFFPMWIAVAAREKKQGQRLVERDAGGTP